MAQKSTRTSKISVNGSPKPRQDAVTTKDQAAQFPGIGMTLRNYKYDPRDHKGVNPRATVVKSSRFRRFRDGVTLKKTVIILALIMLLAGGWVGGKFVYNTHKVFGGSILGVLKTSKLRGEDIGRVNILLAGNSADDIGHNGGQLTDSIIIMSIDTKNNKAFLLSIPRDLYVGIGRNGHSKINYAYVAGEQDKFKEDGLPNGGMGQLEQVIQDSFNIKLNYYALINYNALKQAVDAVGGIDFTVASKDPRGLYDPNIDYVNHKPLVKLTNGVHHLDGQAALDLSRARGDSYRAYGFPASDFDRTENQRQMMVALKTKAVSTGVITNPSKLSALSDVLGKNVKSDLQISEVRRLYDLVKNISGSNIQSLSLNSANGKNLLASYSTPDGQSALVPAAGVNDYSDIQSFLLRQTSSSPIVQEGASIVVLNGTTTTGLASRQKQRLQDNKLIVDKTGDGKDAPITSIIDLSGGKKPVTSALLVKLYGNHLTTINPYAGLYNTDFIVVVGADQIPKPKSSTNTSGQ